MVIFLDFDGVLHPEPCYRKEELFCFLPRFEQVMRQFPEIDIVISSSWRETDDLSALRGHFSNDIAEQLIGVTPTWRDLPELLERGCDYPREIEIRAWMRREREPWEEWIAIDDRPYWFRPFSKNLVVCNSTTGFDDNASRALIKTLQSFEQYRA